MKTLLLVLLLFPIGIKAQEWQTLSSWHFTGTSSFCNGSYFNKSFHINHYDNSIWMSKVSSYGCIRKLDAQGVFSEFSYNNEPLFEQHTYFTDLAFTSDRAFAFRSNGNGLYSYDGNIWNLEANVSSGHSIYAEGDTIWLAREANPYFKWAAGGMSTGTANVRRIKSKNGMIWLGSSDWSITGDFTEPGGYNFHSPDTSIILSSKNHDFKFPHHTDTLYVAGDLGFSLAWNGFFQDTITTNNSSNMPTGQIIEFEFDPQDNIWAVFGTGTTVNDSTTCIAFYDQALESWTQIYDASNSPIPFDNRWVTIEIDTNGNLWATDGRDIHVLKINNWPVWLDLHENETFNFKLYPNPAGDLLKLVGLDKQTLKSLAISDLQGKVLNRTSGENLSETLDVSGFSPGTYFISIETVSGKVGTKKWVKD